MELKYDIYMLNNAQGTGEKRQYIRIVQHEPMTEKQLQEKIQSRCSLRCGCGVGRASRPYGGRILHGTPLLYPRDRLLLHVG